MLDVVKTASSSTVRLGEVAHINPRFDARVGVNDIVPFVPMAAVSASTAAIEAEEKRKYAEVSKGYTAFRNGDVLVAKITPCFENNKIAQALLTGPIGFGSTEFHVVRPMPDRLDARYALHFLRQDHVRAEGERKMTGSAGQRRVPAHVVADFVLHLPPLTEQRRIAAILDEADALRAKRRAALAHLDEMARAIFVEMFGDPVENQRGLATTRLGDVAIIQSGGTPSKANNEFWSGNVPWVSPKDMKRHRICATTDYVSNQAVIAGGLKMIPAGATLIVVRGMILAHTVPVATAGINVTINQDMKAIQFQPPILPEFGFWCLRVQADRILDNIDTASHGTKKLDTDRLLARSILVPDRDHQNTFGRAIAEWERIGEISRGAAHASEELFTSLQHRSFRGEL